MLGEVSRLSISVAEIMSLQTMDFQGNIIILIASIYIYFFDLMFGIFATESWDNTPPVHGFHAIIAKYMIFMIYIIFFRLEHRC
jgi:hypothetical protein